MLCEFLVYNKLIQFKPKSLLTFKIIYSSIQFTLQLKIQLTNGCVDFSDFIDVPCNLAFSQLILSLKINIINNWMVKY